MIKLITLCALLLPNMIYAKAMSKAGIEAYMDSYFEKQLTQDLVRIAPEMQFAVRVKTSLNEKALHSASGQVSQIKLPLGGSFLAEKEVNPIDEEQHLEHPDYYRDALSSVQVELSWDGDLKDENRDWLKAHMVSALRLGTSVSHDVKITSLPFSFSRMIEKKKEKSGWVEKIWPGFRGISQVESAALIIAMLVLGVGFLGFISKLLLSTGLMKGFSNIVKDGVNKISDVMAQSAVVAPAPNVPMNGLANNSSPMISVQNDKFWEGVNVPELRAFAYDCLEHPLYESAAIILIHNFLDSSTAKSLKEVLPPHFFDVDGAGRVLAPASDIDQLFKKNRLQYVLLSEKPLVKSLLSYSAAQCQKILNQFILQNKSVEALSVLHRLTPIKCQLVLDGLSFEERFKLAGWSESKVDHKSLEATENLLAEKLLRPMAKEAEDHAVLYPFKSLGAELFKAKNFEEDEAIHAKLTEQGRNSQSVLAALDDFTAETWASLPLNEVALAYFGHSDDVKEQLLENFDQKRQEWIKNFFQKYHQARLGWDSQDAMVARERIIKLLSLDQEKSMADNNTNEAPPVPFKKAA